MRRDVIALKENHFKLVGVVYDALLISAVSKETRISGAYSKGEILFCYYDKGWYTEPNIKKPLLSLLPLHLLLLSDCGALAVKI